MFGLFKRNQQESGWHRWQRGQAMVEYWPTIPVGIMVMITAGALAGPITNAFQSACDGLSASDTSSVPTATDLNGGHHIEVVSSTYDGINTTVIFRVSSGDQPSISHWVLGIDAATAVRLVSATSEIGDEAPAWTDNDPTTGAVGIKFDIGYEGGGGGGRPDRARAFSASYRPLFAEYVEEREIVLVFSGEVDFVDETEVTTKSGRDQVSTGYVGIPTTGGSDSC